MNSHINLTTGGEDSRARFEKELNERMALKPGVDFGGPDCTANLRRMQTSGGRHTDELCDRLAAAAKERGRPLTAEEIEIVGRHGTLPPVVRVEHPQTFEERFAELEQRVNALDK